MKNELTSLLLSRAEALAEEYYGCDLDRLDPSELEWYTDRVTEDNMKDLAEGLATAAWQAY